MASSKTSLPTICQFDAHHVSSAPSPKSPIESTLIPAVSRTSSSTSITNNNHVPYELNTASPGPTPLQRHHRERPFSSSQSELAGPAARRQPGDDAPGGGGPPSSSSTVKPRPTRHTVDGSQVCPESFPYKLIVSFMAKLHLFVSLEKYSAPLCDIGRFNTFAHKYRARPKGGPQVWRILPGFACRIHATWVPSFSRAL